MSHGPGRVQRAIEETFVAQPDGAFSTKDLCQIVYRLRQPEKAHRVAVLRAAKHVAARRGWGWSGKIFFNRTSEISTGRMLARKTGGARGQRQVVQQLVTSGLIGEGSEARRLTQVALDGNT